MPTIAQPARRRPLPRHQALWIRAQVAAFTAAPFAPESPPPAAEPVHDFLVPNPRPDLTADFVSLSRIT
jgi:hypothetical protein